MQSDQQRFARQAKKKETDYSEKPSKRNKVKRSSSQKVDSDVDMKEEVESDEHVPEQDEDSEEENPKDTKISSLV